MPSRSDSAALKQLCLRGADGLTMEGIADAARVSIGWLYDQWSGLGPLLAEALADGLPRSIHHVNAIDPLTTSALSPDPTSPERLIVESLFVARRFEECRAVVSPLINEWQRSVGLQRSAVVVGFGALRLCGIEVDAQDLHCVSALEARTMRGVDEASPSDRTMIASDLRADLPVTGPTRQDDTSRRLQQAMAAITADKSGAATLRAVADAAGVTTGAIYRRYPSKDDLLADTIRAHVTEDRGGWAVRFLGALGIGDLSGASAVLAQALAQASDPMSPEARQAIGFVAMARQEPGARQVLADRITLAQRTRQAQFQAVGATGAFAHDDSAVALAWAVQCVPTGARLLALAGVPTGEAAWLEPTRRLIASL